MITAAQAQALTSAASAENDIDKRIEVAIREAANDGKYSVRLIIPRPQSRTSLTSAGFTVTGVSGPPPNLYDVSWSV